MDGNPLTTNVAIFWVAGTKPDDGQVGAEGEAEETAASVRKDHWENIFQSISPTEVSWFQERADKSVDFVSRAGAGMDAPIIDVGGGASILVDDLLDMGYKNITVLDLSAAALGVAKERLGERAERVTWLEADITAVDLPPHYYEVWHDRAVFHFLIDPGDRRTYASTVTAALKPGGHLIIATFAADGPQQCSGLNTARYTAEQLQEEFGSSFTLIDSADELHATPFGTHQKFMYCYFEKRG